MDNEESDRNATKTSLDFEALYNYSPKNEVGKEGELSEDAFDERVSMEVSSKEVGNGRNDTLQPFKQYPSNPLEFEAALDLSVRPINKIKEDVDKKRRKDGRSIESLKAEYKETLKYISRHKSENDFYAIKIPKSVSRRKMGNLIESLKHKELKRGLSGSWCVSSMETHKRTPHKTTYATSLSKPERKAETSKSSLTKNDTELSNFGTSFEIDKSSKTYFSKIQDAMNNACPGSDFVLSTENERASESEISSKTNQDYILTSSSFSKNPGHSTNNNSDSSHRFKAFSIDNPLRAIFNDGLDDLKNPKNLSSENKRASLIFPRNLNKSNKSLNLTYPDQPPSSPQKCLVEELRRELERHFENNKSILMKMQVEWKKQEATTCDEDDEMEAEEMFQEKRAHLHEACQRLEVICGRLNCSGDRAKCCKEVIDFTQQHLTSSARQLDVSKLRLEEHSNTMDLAYLPDTVDLDVTLKYLDNCCKEYNVTCQHLECLCKYLGRSDEDFRSSWRSLRDSCGNLRQQIENCYYDSTETDKNGKSVFQETKMSEEKGWEDKRTLEPRVGSVVNENGKSMKDEGHQKNLLNKDDKSLDAYDLDHNDKNINLSVFKSRISLIELDKVRPSEERPVMLSIDTENSQADESGKGLDENNKEDFSENSKVFESMVLNGEERVDEDLKDSMHDNDMDGIQNYNNNYSPSYCGNKDNTMEEEEEDIQNNQHCAVLKYCLEMARGSRNEVGGQSESGLTEFYTQEYLREIDDRDEREKLQRFYQTQTDERPKGVVSSCLAHLCATFLDTKDVFKREKSYDGTTNRDYIKTVSDEKKGKVSKIDETYLDIIGRLNLCIDKFSDLSVQEMETHHKEKELRSEMKVFEKIVGRSEEGKDGRIESSSKEMEHLSTLQKCLLCKKLYHKQQCLLEKVNRLELRIHKKLAADAEAATKTVADVEATTETVADAEAATETVALKCKNPKQSPKTTIASPPSKSRGTFKKPRRETEEIKENRSIIKTVLKQNEIDKKYEKYSSGKIKNSIKSEKVKKYISKLPTESKSPTSKNKIKEKKVTKITNYGRQKRNPTKTLADPKRPNTPCDLNKETKQIYDAKRSLDKNKWIHYHDKVFSCSRLKNEAPAGVVHANELCRRRMIGEHEATFQAARLENEGWSENTSNPFEDNIRKKREHIYESLDPCHYVNNDLYTPLANNRMEIQKLYNERSKQFLQMPLGTSSNTFCHKQLEEDALETSHVQPHTTNPKGEVLNLTNLTCLNFEYTSVLDKANSDNNSNNNNRDSSPNESLMPSESHNTYNDILQDSAEQMRQLINSIHEENGMVQDDSPMYESFQNVSEYRPPSHKEGCTIIEEFLLIQQQLLQLNLYLKELQAELVSYQMVSPKCESPYENKKDPCICDCFKDSLNEVLTELKVMRNASQQQQSIQQKYLENLTKTCTNRADDTCKMNTDIDLKLQHASNEAARLLKSLQATFLNLPPKSRPTSLSPSHLPPLKNISSDPLLSDSKNKVKKESKTKLPLIKQQLPLISPPIKNEVETKFPTIKHKPPKTKKDIKKTPSQPQKELKKPKRKKASTTSEPSALQILKDLSYDCELKIEDCNCVFSIDRIKLLVDKTLIGIDFSDSNLYAIDAEQPSILAFGAESLIEYGKYEVPMVLQPWDLVVLKSMIFVTDCFHHNVIHRIDLQTKCMMKWKLATSGIRKMSKTKEGTLLVTKYPDKLAEYSTDGELVNEVTVKVEGLELSHAIKLDDQNYIVCGSNWSFPSKRICLIDACGHIRKTYVQRPTTLTTASTSIPFQDVRCTDLFGKSPNFFVEGPKVKQLHEVEDETNKLSDHSLTSDHDNLQGSEQDGTQAMYRNSLQEPLDVKTASNNANVSCHNGVGSNDLVFRSYDPETKGMDKLNEEILGSTNKDNSRKNCNNHNYNNNTLLHNNTFCNDLNNCNNATKTNNNLNNKINYNNNRKEKVQEKIKSSEKLKYKKKHRKNSSSSSSSSISSSSSPTISENSCDKLAAAFCLGKITCVDCSTIIEPVYMLVDKEGDIMVCDYAGDSVHLFDPQLNFIRMILGPGSNSGDEVNCCHVDEQAHSQNCNTCLGEKDIGYRGSGPESYPKKVGSQDAERSGYEKLKVYSRTSERKVNEFSLKGNSRASTTTNTTTNNTTNNTSNNTSNNKNSTLNNRRNYNHSQNKSDCCCKDVDYTAPVCPGKPNTARCFPRRKAENICDEQCVFLPSNNYFLRCSNLQSKVPIMEKPYRICLDENSRRFFVCSASSYNGNQLLVYTY